MSNVLSTEQNHQTLLTAIVADPTNETVDELLDQVEAAHQSLVTSKPFGQTRAEQIRSNALDSVFASARAILAKVRK